MFHQYTLLFKRWLLSVTKNFATLASGIMEHYLVLWNNSFLLFVYEPLFETSQEDSGQKSCSLDVLRYQRYGECIRCQTSAKIWQQMFGELH